MKDTYQKITPSQEDGKKLEEKFGQTSAPVSLTLEGIDLKVNSGNILTSKKIKNVTVPVKGLSFKIGNN